VYEPLKIFPLCLGQKQGIQHETLVLLANVVHASS